MSLYFFFTASQIYIFYGTRSNAEFVIHSGFFFDNNSHDRVKIKLGVSKSDRLYAMKAEVLARAGIPTYVHKRPLFPVPLPGVYEQVPPLASIPYPVTQRRRPEVSQCLRSTSRRPWQPPCQCQGVWPETLINFSNCFGVINVFHLEKVNDPDHFVSFNSLPPLASVMKS